MNYQYIDSKINNRHIEIIKLLKIVLYTIPWYLLIFYISDSTNWLITPLEIRVLVGLILIIISMAVTAIFCRYRILQFAEKHILYIAIFCISLTPFRQIRGPDGDAPHYLVAAKHLAENGNLEVDSSYKKRSQWMFHLNGTEKWELPDRRTRTNRDVVPQFWYSLGLTLFIAPFTQLIPRFTVFLFHSLFIFFGLYALWSMKKQSNHSNFDRLILYITTPVILFSAQPYPDTLAFVLGAICIKCNHQNKYVLSSVVSSLFLLLKPIYIIFSAHFLAEIFLRNSFNLASIKKSARYTLPSIFVFLAICFYNFISWGSFSYTSNYRPMNTIFDLSNLLDQVPLFIFGLAGGVFWVWPVSLNVFNYTSKKQFKQNSIHKLRAATAIVYVAIICLTPWSEAGWGPRARYFLVILPFFITYIDNMETKSRALSVLSLGFLSIAGVYPQGNLPWHGLNSPFSIISYPRVLKYFDTHEPAGVVLSVIIQYSKVFSLCLFITSICYYMFINLKYAFTNRKNLCKNEKDKDIANTDILKLKNSNNINL